MRGARVGRRANGPGWTLALACVGAALAAAGCDADGTGAGGGAPDGHAELPAEGPGPPDGQVTPDLGGFDGAPVGGDGGDGGGDGDGGAGPEPELPGADGAPGPDGPPGGNTPPTIGPLPAVVLAMGESKVVSLAGEIGDAEDAPAALVLSFSAAHVAVSDPGDHVVTVIAPTDWHGSDDVLVTVRDSGGLEATAVLAVVVTEVGPGPPPGTCGEVTFSLSAPGAGQVLLSGPFNGWGSAPGQADVMGDPDGDGIWKVKKVLAPGTWQYKFIVDGTWLHDPANPDTTDDGFGGLNSVLEVPECGGLQLVDHATDEAAGTFWAALAGEGVAPGDVTVTVDWDPAPAGALKAVAGGLELSLAGLAQGIHDVRVTHDGVTLLLKVYVGVSTDWRDATLYFALTDRFANGDASNDAPIAGVDPRTNYQGGDFAGITQKIAAGYFDALGVDALWISWPVDNPDFYEDGARVDGDGCGLDPKTTPYVPMRYTGYHGYWPADIEAVEARFGTLQDLQTLVTTAHAHGIRVLLDFTANHVHEASSLWSDHQDDGWFNLPAAMCADIGWDTAPKTCWFVDYLPDLNYQNAAARAAMVDSAVAWVKASGADGLRLDAVKHVEMGFVEALRAATQAELELTGVDFYIVGETFTGDAGAIMAFVSGTRLHGQFDFPSNREIIRGFARREVGLDAMDAAVRGIKGVYGAAAPLMSTFLGNHDIARFVSHASGDIACGVWDVVSNIAQGWKAPPGTPAAAEPYERLRLAFAYVMTVPGVPLVYYGDEVGLPGAGDPDNRRMMIFDGELSQHQEATLAFMKQLAQARQAHAALRKGSWSAPLWSEGDFLAYARQLGGETAIVLLNIGATTEGGALAVGGLGLGDGVTLTEVLAGGGTATVAAGQLPFSVPARSARILVTP